MLNGELLLVGGEGWGGEIRAERRELREGVKDGGMDRGGKHHRT